MNKVASECCGSCGWYCWNGRLLKYTCHNPEIVKQHKQNTFKPESLCVPNYYSPRNPISITDLPEVRELMKIAYRVGYQKALHLADPSFGLFTSIQENEDRHAHEYMKALEDKNEV